MTFKLWSDSNTEALKELKPDFGLRSWNNFPEDDKRKIWKYLEEFFFDSQKKHDFNNPFRDDKGYYFEFLGNSDEREDKRNRIYRAIATLNDLYKAKSHARSFLDDPTFDNACTDFYSILLRQSESVVMELLSLYCWATILEREDKYFSKEPKEDEENYKKRHEEWKWIPFDEFSKKLNDVFSHFGLNLYSTRLGFIPRQEEKISEELFEPVLKSLSNSKWKEVNQLLSDAFADYRKNTPNGFSTCVTNTVSSVQAFLQIVVVGKIGTGDISKLIVQAQAKGLIPTDLFTREIFRNIESVLMRERQETGDAHPKKEYATDKNARMVLNLAMIFFQHCLQQ